MADKPYKLQVFNAHEFATLSDLSEAILRNNEMRGAREAKVDQFIDFQLTHDPQMEARFRAGLKWLDSHARLLHGHDFHTLSTAIQQKMIAGFDIKALHRAGEEKGREFFELARRYTLMGFYASDSALKKFFPKKKATILIEPSSLASSKNEAEE